MLAGRHDEMIAGFTDDDSQPSLAVIIQAVPFGGRIDAQHRVAIYDGVSEAKIIVGDNDGRVYCVEEVGGALLVATNWFRRIDDDWRLLHHQASPLAQAAPPSREPKRSLH